MVIDPTLKPHPNTKICLYCQNWGTEYPTYNTCTSLKGLYTDWSNTCRFFEQIGTNKKEV